MAGVNDLPSTAPPPMPVATPRESWTKWQKWAMSLFCSLIQLAFTLGSSGISPAIPAIAAHFNVSRVVATLSLSLYVLGLGLGSLVMAPLSEVYGRKYVLIPTWTTFCAFIIGSAVSKSITALLVCRTFAAIFGSSVMTAAMGSITDIWSPAESGPPVAIYVMSAFLGPVLGPLTGGYLVQSAPGGTSGSWRWTQWFLLIFSGVLGVNLLWVPETHQPTLIRRHRSLEKVSIRAPITLGTMKTSILRPLELLVLDPIVFLTSLYMSLIFGILFLYFGAYQITFINVYGWNIGSTGLAFLGLGVGILLASFTSAYGNKLYVKMKTKRGIQGPYPEGRLPLAFPASLLAPISAFWFGWSSKAVVHWSAPVISGVPFGWSMVTIFVTHIGYLVEAYPKIGASAVGSATFLRSLFGFAFPLFTTALYTTLSTGWSGTLLGFLLVAFAPIPWTFFKYGPWLRSKSRYTSQQ